MFLNEVIDLILGPLGVVLGLFVTGVVSYFGGKSSGKKGTKNEQLADTLKRVEEGRQHVRDNRGNDPVERVRDNDEAWR